LRYPPELTAERHERILDEASRLFRERGLDKTGVAEIMKAASLTHGGFYAHFDSKDALAAEATARCVSQTERIIQKAVESEEDVLPFMAKRYLTPSHRDNPGAGCGIAALAPEMARQSEQVRSAFTTELDKVLGLLSGALDAADGSSSRAEAIRTFSSLVGAILLARAVNDSKLSDEILAAVREKL
jgi:TetR/AcrR family transcriptional repressor of nem operon